jgi:N,N'-diacetyllegionaminate synthase
MLSKYTKDRCYIIAEIGGNFTTYRQAKTLIDMACECGVDAIKLQTYEADTVASRQALFDMENTGKISQYNLFKKYEIDKTLHSKVIEYAEKKELDWFSTPSHENDVELLEGLGIKAYKIGSDDTTNIPFLRMVARKGRPIFLSTGMCTMQEVHDAVNAILENGNSKIILLHAVTSYPTHAEHVNLNAMISLIKEFPLFDVGFSDHTIGITASLCAVAMGARVIEKHFTYDKKADGPDHSISADPIEMKNLIENIRELEKMKGDGIKRPSGSEAVTRVNNRKSIVASMKICENELLTVKNIAIKRPGYGIQPQYYEQVIGKKAKRTINIDDVIKWEDFY